MADPVETAEGFFKEIIGWGEGGVTGILGWGAWIILGLVFLGLVWLATWYFLRWMKFNKTIIVFENINGVWKRTKKDKAMEVKFSTAGDTIFYARKYKKYLPNPSIQSGPREYWYFIRRDGEWINFGLKDLDEQMKVIGAHFLDKEMRYARTQIQKGLKERYDKPGFWKQYGLLIFSLGFIAMFIIGIFLLSDKYIQLTNSVKSCIDAVVPVLEKADAILGKVDSISAGGSGLAAGG